MVIYECDRCHKKFNHKQKYEIHLQRKNPCKICVKNDDLNDIVCENCGKTFARKDVLKKHLDKHCSGTSTVKELLQQIKTLKSEVKDLKNTSQIITGNNNQIISGNNTQIFIGNDAILKLRAFGDEDTSGVTQKEYLKFMQHGFRSIPELVETIHFDKNKPENHNVYIPNIREGYAMVHKGNNVWKLADKKQTIQSMCSKNKDLLEEKLDEFGDKLVEQTKTRFDKFIDDYDNDNKTVMKKLTKEVGIVLTNNNELPKATRKKINDQV